MRTIALTLFIAILALRATHAQTPVPPTPPPTLVPDLAGMTGAEAAAALNRNGLQLSRVVTLIWEEGQGSLPNRVSSHSPPAGSQVLVGSGIVLTVHELQGAQLQYTTTDLTFVNQTGQLVDLTNMLFTSLDGDRVFNGGRWGNTLDNGDCVQIWSVNRVAGRELPVCDDTDWLAALSTQVHFWTEGHFIVRLSTGEVITCPPADVIIVTCQLTPSSAPPAADLARLVYDTDQLAIINPSSDQWLPLERTVIYNFNPAAEFVGLPIIPGNPEVYDNAPTIGDLTRLAPNQCYLFAPADISQPVTPEYCDVIARSTPAEGDVFWRHDFDVLSFARGTTQNCPAATEDDITVCQVFR